MNEASQDFIEEAFEEVASKIANENLEHGANNLNANGMAVVAIAEVARQVCRLNDTLGALVGEFKQFKDNQDEINDIVAKACHHIGAIRSIYENG